MRDVVERAKDNLSSYDYAHAYGCDPGYPVVLIRDLVAEVERLRGPVDDMSNDPLTELDTADGCWCASCAAKLDKQREFYRLCPDCGNKRCPRCVVP